MQLIGREPELAEVGWLLSCAVDGCAALSVVAAPGSGKTALLDAASERALHESYRVLRCTGVEAESDLAYAAVTDLLGPVLADVRQWLPAPQQRALDAVALRTDAEHDVVEPQAVARATVSVLARAAAAGPLVVIVDDAHWLDAESRRALAFAARRAEQRLALIVARRPHGDLPEDELSLALRSLGDDRHRELQVAALSRDEIEELLIGRGFTLPRAALRRIQRLAAGNPLYAVELARAASTGRDEHPAVPTSLGTLLRARIEALPRNAVTVVGAAAQMSAPTRALIRRAVSGEAAAEGELTDAAVDAAIDADILTETDGVVRFAHPLIAEAATAMTTVGFRRRVHRRLADAVTDVTARAVHLSMAHDEASSEVAAAIEAGATQARARAAPEVAAELLAAAVRLTPDDDSEGRRRRRVECAYHWVAAGNVGRGIDLLSDALADEPQGPARADLEWRTAMLHFLAGDLSTCIALLESASVHAHDARLALEITVRLASMYCWMGRFRDGAATCERLDMSLLSGLPRINALGNLAVTRFATGDPPSVDAHQLMAEFEALDPPPPPHEHPASRLVHVLLVSEPADVTAAAIEPAFGAAVAAEDDIGIAWNAAALARTRLHAGRWTDAAELANEALKAGRRAQSTPARVLALTAASVVAAHRGDVAAAHAAADELSALGSGQPYMMCVEQAELVRGFLTLSTGDGATAARHLTAAAECLTKAGLVEPSMPPPRWFLLEALIDAGWTTAADVELDALSGFAEEREHALAAAVAWSGRGRIAALQGDRAASDDAFDRALRAHERLGWPFERAVTLFGQGRAQRQQQRRALARDSLTEAADVFRRLGATLWERRARAELAAVSGRAPSAPTELTETERRVAELAAAGLKNQEIADRLFVSTKTVATHLSRVYAKLQLRSRTELARHLTDATGSL